MRQKLWTKDFTIITLGSVVSMLGNSLVGFSISLLALDYSNMPILYALFMFFHTLPQIVMPVIAGPFMDRFSCRRTIYLLDFLSALLYCSSGLLIMFGSYNFVFLAVLALLSGSIHSFYSVAFSSFYPLLITEGNYSKAYSVSSTLETFSYVMVPVSTFLYNLIGIEPLMIATSLFFLIAAIVETRISDVESKTHKSIKTEYGLKKYILDSKEGIKYLWNEKGLLCITLYFVFSSFAMGASAVITLPWFKSTYENGEYTYISVWALTAIGRIAGSLIHYRFKMPAKAKYRIALTVYLISCIIEGIYLYTPLVVMRIICFALGILGVTSYNIRISATQTYVPNEKRGRFHGAFLMLTTVGTLLGELVAGIITSFIPPRPTLSIFLGLCAIAAIVFIAGGRKHIKPIYNQET